MDEHLNLNDASAVEIELLLGISSVLAKELSEGRPYVDSNDLVARRPADLRLERLELPKLDLNSASAGLLERLGLSQQAAAVVVAARPIYDMRALKELKLSTAEVAQVSRVFHVRPLSYVDKAAGAPVNLSPSADTFIVRLKDPEAESAELIKGTPGLRPAGRSGAYRLIKAADEEAGVKGAVALSNEPEISLAVPAFEANDGTLRFLDPQYLVIQFSRNTTTDRYDEILSGLDLVPHERMRTPGLLVARFIAGSTTPTRLGRTLMALNGTPEVDFAEPAYLGFDDLEAGSKQESTNKAIQSNATTPKSNGPPTVVTASAKLDSEGDGAAELDYLAMIGARSVWKRGKGDPAVWVVAVDTGVNLDHPAFQGVHPDRKQADWNYTSEASPAPEDHHGHGTFVAGLAIGRGGAGVWGVAPGCGFIPLKVPLTASIDSYSRRRDAILAAVDLATAGRKIVLNLSWRTAGDIALVRMAVKAAIDAGVIVVASAGNDPGEVEKPHFPSDYPGVLSAGAVATSGIRAAYSQSGKEIDLAAPGGDGPNGANLRSAALDGGTREDWGTSFAAAILSGAAALFWSHKPSLNANAVVAQLKATAKPLPNEDLGAGLVDLTAALSLASDAVVENDNSLEWLDRLTMVDLRERFGLLAFTSRLLLSRRPFRNWAEVQQTTGLGEKQFLALRAASLA